MSYSYSSISTYSTCSLKYYFQYILKINFTDVGVAPILGQCLHKAIEFYYRNLGTTKIDFINHFKFLYEDAFLTNNIIEYFPKHKETAYQMGLRAIEQFFENDEMTNAKPAKYLLDENEIEAIELYFNLPLIDLKSGQNIGENLHISGLIDLVEQKDGKLKVKDHKTSSKDYEKFFITTSLQLAIYSYAVRFLLKEKKFKDVLVNKEESVGFNIFLKPKNKSELKIIEKKISTSDLENLYLTVKNLDKAVKNEIFIPANNDSCFIYNTPCQYMGICEAYQKNQQPFKNRILDVDGLKKLYGERVVVRNENK